VVFQTLVMFALVIGVVWFVEPTERPYVYGVCVAVWTYSTLRRASKGDFSAGNFQVMMASMAFMANAFLAFSTIEGPPLLASAVFGSAFLVLSGILSFAWTRFRKQWDRYDVVAVFLVLAGTTIGMLLLRDSPHPFLVSIPALAVVVVGAFMDPA